MENEYFSLDEVTKKINQELLGQYPAILKRAKYHCDKIRYYFEPEELINEAAKRFLEPNATRRRWRKDLGIIQAFNGAMRSITDEFYQQIKRHKKRTISLPENPDAELNRYLTDSSENPEDRLTFKREILNLTDLFSNDRTTSLFFEYRCLSLTKKEIMEKLSINSREYEALLKKFMRRIRRYSS